MNDTVRLFLVSTVILFLVATLLLTAAGPSSWRPYVLGAAVSSAIVGIGLITAPLYQSCVDDRDRNYVQIELGSIEQTTTSRDGEEPSAAEEPLREKVLDALFPGTLFAPHDDVKEESTCVVCLDSIEPNDLVSSGSSCDHLFHRPCVLQWLMNRRKSTCPTCRNPMWTEDEYASLLEDLLRDDGPSKKVVEMNRLEEVDTMA